MTFGRLAQAHKLLGTAESLSRGSHFNSEECRVLVTFHQKLVQVNGPLDRLRFRDVLHVTFDITGDVMLDLVFRAFDRDNDGVIDETEWAKGLSVMIRGTLEELVEFVYFVYDMNGDRSLAREELNHCLRGCMHSGYGIDTDELEECERDIVEIAMKKLDVDRDGQITYLDFQNAVAADPTLLQACGTCLPAPKSCASFLALVTLRYRSYTGVWDVAWTQGKVEPKPSRGKSVIPRITHANAGVLKKGVASAKSGVSTTSVGKRGGRQGSGGQPQLVAKAPPPTPRPEGSVLSKI